MLSSKPIDASKLKFRYSGATEHYEYDRATEKRAEHQTRDENTGMPVWKVRCVAIYQNAGEHGEITVSVPHPVPPTAEFDSFITFTNPTVKDWSMNGNQGQTWHAEAFEAEAATAPPSTNRTKKPEPTAA